MGPARPPAGAPRGPAASRRSLAGGPPGPAALIPFPRRALAPHAGLLEAPDWLLVWAARCATTKWLLLAPSVVALTAPRLRFAPTAGLVAAAIAVDACLVALMLASRSLGVGPGSPVGGVLG